MQKKSFILVFFLFLFMHNSTAKASDVNIECDGKSDISDKLSEVHNVRINFSEGICLFSKPITLFDNVILNGAGNNKTILKAPSGLAKNISFISVGGDKLSQPAKDITISNLTLYGRNEENGFSEHNHLLSLKGVEDLKVYNTRFLAFQGDAIYIGKSNVENKKISISNNYFDGLNYKNRNAISVITGSDISILSNFFFRTTMRNMPGAIDLEPNNGSEHFIERVVIKNNKLLSIGGKAAIVVSIRHIYKSQIHDITIVDNKIYNTKRGVYLYAKNQTIKSMPYNFTISNNRILGAKIRPLLVCNIEKVKMADKEVDFNSLCPLTQRTLSMLN